MADAGASSEQNKTEDATPFKLKRAREKGSVARGVDLGFFAALAGFSVWAFIAAPTAAQRFTQMARGLIGNGDFAHSPERTLSAIGLTFTSTLQAVALICASIVLSVIFFEIVQLRGLIFSTAPLKPDFGRLNPSKNLKRLFSFRILKETGKSIVKLAAYAVVAWLVVNHDAVQSGRAINDASSLLGVLRASAIKLLLAYVLLALFFALIDQIIVRGEFRKQMRMSRRDLVRESREREGEPRQKQKRRQLHREFTKRTQALGNLPGADMLIVNPEHFAVALAYDAKEMSAPTIMAKGRNHFALHLKRQAATHNIPIFENPPLARALYKSGETGAEISGSEYRAVADLYLKLARTQRSETIHA